MDALPPSTADISTGPGLGLPGCRPVWQLSSQQTEAHRLPTKNHKPSSLGMQAPGAGRRASACPLQPQQHRRQGALHATGPQYRLETTERGPTPVSFALLSSHSPFLHESPSFPLQAFARFVPSAWNTLSCNFTPYMTFTFRLFRGAFLVAPAKHPCCCISLGPAGFSPITSHMSPFCGHYLRDS